MLDESADTRHIEIMVFERDHRAFGAVVLAAGASTRLGFPKQLVRYEGQPLVRRMAVAAVDAGADPVVVVLGADAEMIAPVLAGLTSVRTVVNREWSSGLASSLAAGLREVFGDNTCEAVLVTLADQPLVDSAALKKLIGAFDRNHRIVASAYANTLGVPAVFGREYMHELVKLTGDAGAGSWLRSRAGEVTPVAFGGGALDIDGSSDIAQLNQD
ncbi:MAG TPA: nucleotidyltransferase family protein [Gemmatimonadaceae bacterium]|nr:nucleotidyltransferase family protein [Gemmatimonadaceae bacterium]